MYTSKHETEDLMLITIIPLLVVRIVTVAPTVVVESSLETDVKLKVVLFIYENHGLLLNNFTYVDSTLV